LPHRPVDDDRPVGPVDHPPVARRDPAHGREKGVRIDRLPVREVVNGVEFHKGNVERGGDLPGKPRLADSCVPDDRHPLHRRPSWEENQVSRQPVLVG